MASEARHAAWQNEKRFAVTLLPGQGPAEILASGLTEFLDAVDVAAEWVRREEGGRAETASLAIFKTHAGVTEKVWAYPPEPAASGQPLVKTFGFDPVSWRAPGREFEAEKRLRSTLLAELAADRQPRVLPAGPTPPAASAKAAWPTGELASAADRTTGSLRDAARAGLPPEQDRSRASRAGGWHQWMPERVWIEARLRAAWDDQVSRCCLLLGLGALWLSLTLVDLRALALLLIALPGLWWRRAKRAAAAAAIEDEDWL